MQSLYEMVIILKWLSLQGKSSTSFPHVYKENLVTTEMEFCKSFNFTNEILLGFTVKKQAVFMAVNFICNQNQIGKV